MQFKTSMKTIAGAVALALSSHVFAQAGNVVGVGDIYLSIDDTTTGASYILDTGINASSFSGSSSITPHRPQRHELQQLRVFHRLG
jgi:hypothetical protein